MKRFWSIPLAVVMAAGAYVGGSVMAQPPPPPPAPPAAAGTVSVPEIPFDSIQPS